MVVFGWVRARGCALRVAIVRDAFRPKSVHFEDILAICVSKILWGSHVKRMTLKLCECEIVTV